MQWKLTMDPVDDIIRRAYEEGQFRDLPGKGQPLKEDPFSNVPEELRSAYRILANAGHVPPEVAKYKEIASLRDRLLAFDAESEDAKCLKRQIALRQIELSLATERLMRKGFPKA